MKIVKMAAIATMALTLFASCKKDEPKKEVSSICIRLNDTELRALESQIADKSEGVVTKDLKVIINDGDQILSLGESEITEAKSAAGYTTGVKVAVTKVAITGNGVVTGQPITKYQGLGADFLKVVPLKGETTEVASTEAGGITTYSVTLNPTPDLARLEVFGKIEPKANDDGKNAFKSVTIEEVNMNNYRTKGGEAARTYIKANPALTGFASDVEASMKDVIPAAKLDDFGAGNVVAGYQLFPETKDELTANPLPKDFYNHVILKVTVKYDTKVAKNVKNDTYTGYITIISFYNAAKGDLKGFEAGYVYKLDLAELADQFKTGKDGDPETPVTPEPEPESNKKLNIKVNPYKWEAKNIKPDVIKK